MRAAPDASFVHTRLHLPFNHHSTMHRCCAGLACPAHTPAPAEGAGGCGGQVVRPVLGISIAPPQTLRQLRQDGVLILEVPSGTPASKAGIKGTFRWVPDHHPRPPSVLLSVELHV